MGKNCFKKKNHKPFNSIRNVEKLLELRSKIKKHNPDNNEREPGTSSSSPGEKEDHMFSEKDREILLHVRKLFSKNGKMPEYHEESNAIILAMKGEIGAHPFIVAYRHNVLSIFSLKKISTNNSSERIMKYIMALNSNIPMGSFDYSLKREGFIFKLGIPLHRKPTKVFIVRLIVYVSEVMDEYIPKIFSCFHASQSLEKEVENPTYH